MSDVKIEWLDENTCRDCGEYYSTRGYVLCTDCLYGKTSRLVREDIKRLKEYRKEKFVESQKGVKKEE